MIYWFRKFFYLKWKYCENVMDVVFLLNYWSPIQSLITYEAWMQLGGCRIGVRCGPTRGAASDAAARALVLRLSFLFMFYFFFHMDSHGLSFNLHRTRQIRPKSSHIGQIKSYRPTIETAKIDRNGRNRPWIPKHSKFKLGNGVLNFSQTIANPIILRSIANPIILRFYLVIYNIRKWCPNL